MSSMFARMAGVQLAGVSYRGGAEAIADVAAGRIGFTFADFSFGMAQARAGRVRVLGHSLDRPFDGAPELVPVAAVVPGFDVNVWWGLAAPAGTPPAIVGRLNAALNAVLEGEAVGARLRQLGYRPMPMTSSGFADYMRRQVAIWGERVRLAGIEPQ
jgi:tripartite-type tricarboxylate transporter receptor subunit TctC